MGSTSVVAKLFETDATNRWISLPDRVHMYITVQNTTYVRQHSDEVSITSGPDVIDISWLF